LVDYLDIVEALYIERCDTVLRNTLLLGLAGVEDGEVNPDPLGEFTVEREPGVVQDPQARRQLIAQLAAG
ncbi:hypothetical protein, partial [Streptosporangium sp. NPDC003464]